MYARRLSYSQGGKKKERKREGGRAPPCISTRLNISNTSCLHPAVLGMIPQHTCIALLQIDNLGRNQSVWGG